MTKIEKQAKEGIYLVAIMGDKYQITEYCEGWKAWTYGRPTDKWAALWALTIRRAEVCEARGQEDNYYRRLLNRGSSCREKARA
jgi:hypothetical protein